MWWGGLSMPESNFTHYENRCKEVLAGVVGEAPAAAVAAAS